MGGCPSPRPARSGLPGLQLVEDVPADHVHLLQAPGPGRLDVVRVVVGRAADVREVGPALQHRLGDAGRVAPGGAVEELIARRPDLRLLTAVNGTLGIEVARASQPEMILMDVNLPDISGIEAMKILREDPVTAHIPIVALSANAMPRDIRKGLEAGFFRYLTKPIKVNEFMDTLRMALEFAEQRAAEEGRPLEIDGFTLAGTVKAEPPRAPAARCASSSPRTIP